MILDLTTSKLQVLLAGAITTNQLPVTVDAVDSTANGFTPVATFQNTNSGNPVDILAAPASGHYRKVNALSVYNADTVAATVTIRRNDNSTTYVLMVVTLAAGETLHFTDTQGWFVLDASGQKKTTMTIPSGVYIGRSFITYTDGASHTFTQNPLTRRLRAMVQAGGAGGGGVDGTAGTNVAAAGGGGAGGYAEREYTAVTAATVFSAVVGAKGAGGTAGANPGTAGGDSTFTDGTTMVTAKGGNPGTGDTGDGTTSHVAGGAVSTGATNGQVDIPGEAGADSLTVTNIFGLSGRGGHSVMGKGGSGLVRIQADAASTAGTNATGNGAGGGGAASGASATNVAGGDGTNGLIIVEEYT
jgi:hypothetical protein